MLVVNSRKLADFGNPLLLMSLTTRMKKCHEMHSSPLDNSGLSYLSSCGVPSVALERTCKNTKQKKFKQKCSNN